MSELGAIVSVKAQQNRMVCPRLRLQSRGDTKLHLQLNGATSMYLQTRDFVMER